VSNPRREIDDIGRSIWPDPQDAYRAMHARRRRWWLAFLQPRRPQLASRWLPVLAAVATVAIFLGIAGARPALERTDGRSHHGARPSAQPSGELSNRATGVPAPGQGVAVLPTHPSALPPAPARPTAVPVQGGSEASPQRTPASDTAVPATVVLTEADAGKTITVAPGTRVVVRLQGSPRRQWTAPRSLDSTVLSTSDAGRDSGGAAHGNFLASHSGRTRVVATQEGCRGPLCLFGSATPWQVRIVVS
jgi:hypothetical protein